MARARLISFQEIVVSDGLTLLCLGLCGRNPRELRYGGCREDGGVGILSNGHTNTHNHTVISVVKRETTTKVAVLRARSNRKRTETKGKETRKGEKARVLPYWVRRLALRVFGGSFECPLRALSLGICSVSISGTILLLIVSDLQLTNKWDRLSTASEAYPTAGNFLTALTVFDDPEASFKVVQNAFLLGRRHSSIELRNVRWNVMVMVKRAIRNASYETFGKQRVGFYGFSLREVFDSLKLNC
ncbi:hypothetical protein DL96DRAFT_1563608 [Flagelloscypha sp. PMI_526]|nr:hypothetical protein DL96DRAFT_1563608 [Flagelloscypha sp. PMI_526]